MQLDSFDVGRVTFVKSMSSITDAKLQDFLDRLKALKEKEDTIENEKFKDRPIAMIELANDSYRVEPGILEVERALSVLCFYLSGLLPYHPAYYRMSMGIEGKVFTGTTGAIVIGDKHRYFQSTREGSHRSYPLNADYATQMNNLHLKRINEILRKAESKRTEFEKSVLNAIEYYAMAIGEYRYGNALVNFMTALESLLLKKRESKGATLAERCSILLGTDPKSRTNCYDRVKRIYDLRSDFVHEGKADLTKDDMHNVATLVYDVIMKLLPLTDKIPNKTALKAKFKELQFSCPPFSF